MNIKILSATVAGLLLLGSSAFGAATAPAPAAAAKAAPAKKADYCDRECLKGVMEKYLAAMVAHDPSKAPFAKNALYAENEIFLKMPDGIWRTATSVGKYRVWVVEPGRDVAVYVDATENGLPFHLAVRLKMSGRTIVGSEVVTNGRDNYGAPTGNVQPREPRPQFAEVVPVKDRVSRQEMIRIANTYFDGIENNVGDHVPPFSDDCVRIENGNQTSGRPIPPTAPSAAPTTPARNPCGSATTATTPASATAAT